MQQHTSNTTPLNKLILLCLEQRVIVTLTVALLICWGVLVAPFGWDLGGLQVDPVPTDAIPDIGENQQIVFTQWSGQSPQDVDDQISYPLSAALLGMSGVKSVRSYSMFGFSSIFVIFDDDTDFYWGRTRILEKISSLPSGTVPDGVQPTLGPEATALGQVYWYTLEGRDEEGNVTGGWDLQELRSIQDWTVRYRLMAVDGVAEVASIGGFVQEYQIDIDPDAMRAHNITLEQVFKAVRESNIDSGARTIEINAVEYVIRGLGLIESVEDLEKVAVSSTNNLAIRLSDVAHISLGPAERRGVLDKGGAEAVGGVVVARFGENPRQVIENVKQRIQEIAGGLPTKILPDGRVSRVTIVPFYDRSELIEETLDTLNDALIQQILVTVLVVVVMLWNLRTSILISAMLPVAVLLSFVGMKLIGVDANIVALSGIAIAVGTIVDVGIVLCENILKHFEKWDGKGSKKDVVYAATTEVGGAVLAAVMTTIVGFLPVFTLEAAEGKMFRPLAFTKTLVLAAAIMIALMVMPAIAQSLLAKRDQWNRTRNRRIAGIVLSFTGLLLLFSGISIEWSWVDWIGPATWADVMSSFSTASLNGWPWHIIFGSASTLFGLSVSFGDLVPQILIKLSSKFIQWIVAISVWAVLTILWEPLGQESGTIKNAAMVGVLLGLPLLIFYTFRIIYPRLLSIALEVKSLVIVPTIILIAIGCMIWMGYRNIFGWVPINSITSWTPIANILGEPIDEWLDNAFPGMGKEFMPALDEGAFLYMPSTMPHASIGEATDVLQKTDMAMSAVPEVDIVVGKIGRVESPLDPAPISMLETIITYKPEYIEDESGHRKRFQYNKNTNEYDRDNDGNLIPDNKGKPYRQWRDEVQNPDDIWAAVLKAAEIPGTTSASKLQPIETRLVMLQTGFRSSMGIKVFGPDLNTIEQFGLKLEQYLKEVPVLEPSTVFSERIVGKPYLEIKIDRERIARYGISMAAIHRVISTAIGGKQLSTAIKGRERYPIRVRYVRERRDQFETLGDILVSTPTGLQIPLTELSEIKYVRGPQVVKSEDSVLVGYVLFDSKSNIAEVTAVETAQQYINDRIASGELVVPPGVTFRFAGTYESQIRAAARLKVILPLSLVVICGILFVQFRSGAITLIVFSGVFLAWSGGFILMWLYGQPWFLNFSVAGQSMRDVFQVNPINLSVAVWVGFLALFGIATDDGVVMATRLRQSFAENKPSNIAEIRAATVEAGSRRVRACLMTTATTILALLPILTSQGRGSDIMIPMAIPSVGGMCVELLTLFVVPVLYCSVEEWRYMISTKWKTNSSTTHAVSSDTAGESTSIKTPKKEDNVK